MEIWALSYAQLPVSLLKVCLVKTSNLLQGQMSTLIHSLISKSKTFEHLKKRNPDMIITTLFIKLWENSKMRTFSCDFSGACQAWISLWVSRLMYRGLEAPGLTSLKLLTQKLLPTGLTYLRMKAPCTTLSDFYLMIGGRLFQQNRDGVCPWWGV